MGLVLAKYIIENRACSLVGCVSDFDLPCSDVHGSNLDGGRKNFYHVFGINKKV